MVLLLSFNLRDRDEPQLSCRCRFRITSFPFLITRISNPLLMLTASLSVSGLSSKFMGVVFNFLNDLQSPSSGFRSFSSRFRCSQKDSRMKVPCQKLLAIGARRMSVSSSLLQLPVFVRFLLALACVWCDGAKKRSFSLHKTVQLTNELKETFCQGWEASKR